MVALETLGALSADDRLERFLRGLTDRSWEVRVAAAEQLELELAGKGQAPPALRQCLKDPSNLVRLQAAEALGMIGDKKALPGLRATLKDKDPSVRSYVAEALGRLGGANERRLLTNTLRSERSENARLGLFYGLYLLGNGHVLSDLLSFLDSESYLVRSSAAAALRDVKGNRAATRKTIPKLREVLKRETTAAREQMESTLRHLRSARRTVQHES